MTRDGHCAGDEGGEAPCFAHLLEDTDAESDSNPTPPEPDQVVSAPSPLGARAASAARPS